jgi:environmental stress-induced protein Ves
MDVIRYDELVETPWKNGGGVTREIATAQSSSSFLWRLSMADVTEDGAFSDFAGVIRVLTVIKGGSVTLKYDTDALLATLWEPVQFDGASKIHATLNDGPLTDLNLMFDPKRCEGRVETLRGPHQKFLELKAQRTYAIHILAGGAKFGPDLHLQTGDTLLLTSTTGQIDLRRDAACLLITIDADPQIEASKLVIAAR